MRATPTKPRSTQPRRVTKVASTTASDQPEPRKEKVVPAPKRNQAGDAVRAKLAALGITEADIAAAISYRRGER